MIRLRRKVVRSDRLRFGYLGGNIGLKGIDVLLDAFQSLKDANIGLVLAGPELDQLPGHLSANVKLVGAYMPDDVGGLMSEFDVLVVPVNVMKATIFQLERLSRLEYL